MAPKIVFMGTPEFAVPALQALIDEGYEIALVVTQPDKPVGRKRVLTAPPVKKLAEAYNLPVFQPAKMKKDESVHARLREAEADLFVVVAYGKILPQAVLDIPKRGCINVHASLLPKYRGSAPIQWAIVHGERESGVTTMLMDAGMDTGDMLLKASLPISPVDTGVTLSEKLSALGAQTLIKTLPAYLSGELQAQPQDHEAATVIPLLRKEHGEIKWTQSAFEIDCQIRGLQPWPGTYSYFQDRSLKIKAARVAPDDSGHAGRPGQIVDIVKESVFVRCGEGVLELLRVHPADSKEMSAGAFARGKRLEPGDFLGAAPRA